MNEELTTTTINFGTAGLAYELRVARVGRPLAEWLRLNSGDEIALEPVAIASATEGVPVEILRSGQRVALGELVRIDEQFAVRILQIFDVSGERSSKDGWNQTGDNIASDKTTQDCTAKDIMTEGGVS